MADITEIGFGVDTSGPDKLAQSVDQLKQSIDQLNQKLTQTPQAAQASANSFNQMAASAATAKAATVGIGDNLQGLGRAATESNTALGSFGASIASLFASLTGSSSALKGHAEEARNLGEEYGRTESASRQLREGLHTLDPILGALGVTTGNLTQFTGAARAGMEALAVAVAGTVVVELQKLSDTAQATQQHLQGLTTQQYGKDLAASFQSLVDGAGHLPTAMLPAIDAITKIQQATSSGIITPGAVSSLSGFRSAIEEATGASESLFNSLRLGGANAATAQTEAIKFLDTLGKEGKLTSQNFQELNNTSGAPARRS